MSNNNNLQQAKNTKNDEFYTLMEDIEKELEHYSFKGLRVHCPCDNPKYSNFYKYFKDNFERLGLKELVATSYDSNTITAYNGFEEVLHNPNGDFRKTIPMINSDIIVTNPPFSLFREFINLLVQLSKHFLIIGALNGVKYKDTFPLIKEGKIWLGVNHGAMNFIVPEDFVKDNVFIDNHGRKLAKFGNIVWFTNHTSTYTRPFLSLITAKATDYQSYDNYNAIDVPKVKNIPDLSCEMGVPITFLQYHNQDQFEILGELNHGCDNQYDFAKPIIKGKELFPRILICKKG